MLKNLISLIKRKIINRYIHTELVYPQENEISPYFIRIKCNYPFERTILFIPKEHIINFEHCADPSYSCLFYVKKNIFRENLDFKLYFVPPVKLNQTQLDDIEKELSNLLHGAVD